MRQKFDFREADGMKFYCGCCLLLRIVSSLTALIPTEIRYEWGLLVYQDLESLHI